MSQIKEANEIHRMDLLAQGSMSPVVGYTGKHRNHLGNFVDTQLIKSTELIRT